MLPRATPLVCQQRSQSLLKHVLLQWLPTPSYSELAIPFTYSCRMKEYSSQWQVQILESNCLGTSPQLHCLLSMWPWQGCILFAPRSNNKAWSSSEASNWVDLYKVLGTWQGLENEGCCYSLAPPSTQHQPVRSAGDGITVQGCPQTQKGSLHIMATG